VGGFGLVLHGLPIATTAWVAWLVATPFVPWPGRRAGLLVVLALVFGSLTLIRNEGTDGLISSTFRWRWSATAEDQFLAQVAAGRLNCLDGVIGKVIWSRDITADSGAKVPQWGYAASPLVVQGVITVFAGGPDGKAVLGYNAATGEPAWSAGEGQYSYCS